jgi:hypothetical protein
MNIPDEQYQNPLESNDPYRIESMITKGIRIGVAVSVCFLLSVLFFASTIPEPEVKKRPCVGKLSGYVKISFDKGINCNGDTLTLENNFYNGGKN